MKKIIFKFILRFQIKKDFIQLIVNHPDIDRHMRWQDVKKMIDMDSRYRAVENSIMRENFFHDACKIMKNEKRKSKEKREKEKSKRKDKDRESDNDRHKDKHREKERDKSRDKNRDDKDCGDDKVSVQ